MVRTFKTGATRNSDEHKFDYEGFISPIVLESFGEYMHSKRLQADGVLRDGDNWQKGIEVNQYMKSLIRHVFALWKLHRGYKVYDDDTKEELDLITILNACLFNIQGYMHELLKQKYESR